MEFSRQDYWSGLPFPPLGDLPEPGIEAGSPALQADSLPTELQGKPISYDEPSAKRTHLFIPHSLVWGQYFLLEAQFAWKALKYLNFQESHRNRNNYLSFRLPGSAHLLSVFKHEPLNKGKKLCLFRKHFPCPAFLKQDKRNLAQFTHKSSCLLVR